MVIRSLIDPMPLALVIPLDVEPETEYEIVFGMKSTTGEEVETGMGYMEFDTYIPFDDSFTVNLSEEHVLGGEKVVSIFGPYTWTPFRFSPRMWVFPGGWMNWGSRRKIWPSWPKMPRKTPAA